LIYLKMGFSRIPRDAAKDILPRLVLKISTRPASQQMTLFAIALPIIGAYNDLNVTVDDPFQFKQYPADLDFWIASFLKMILYTVPSSGRQQTALTQNLHQWIKFQQGWVEMMLNLLPTK
jgi:Proteasome stabiliser